MLVLDFCLCELYGGVMATMQQEIIKLNKFSLGPNLVIFNFISHASLE
jgi:hypothetical protein